MLPLKFFLSYRGPEDLLVAPADNLANDIPPIDDVTEAREQSPREEGPGTLY